MMKKIIFIIAGVISGLTLQAADLVVQDGGPVGTFGSIGSAISAASDGDRILINNQISGLPWLEDITIDKSLTLLSAVDNQRFLVQGDYVIEHAPGREVNIIGMENKNGNITAAAHGITSDAFVNILSCKFYSNILYFNYNFFHLDASSNEGGTIYFFHGRVIGNDLGNGSVYLQNDVVSGNDTVFIVANKLRHISLSSPDYYFYVSNNLVSQSSSSSNAISVSSLKIGPNNNMIRNNTINANDYGIRVSTSSAGNITIINNVVADYSAGNYGINVISGPIVTASFNYVDQTFDNSKISGVPYNGTNITNQLFSVNTTTGTNTLAITVNGGSGGIEDFDLDLTRNDAGCLGGSYTLNNFHPIDGSSSKVYFLTMPKQIITGAANKVKGYSFDR